MRTFGVEKIFIKHFFLYLAINQIVIASDTRHFHQTLYTDFTKFSKKILTIFELRMEFFNYWRYLVF